MNSKTFEEIITKQIDICKSVLIDKAKQYADDSDRLHNFKIASVIEGCTPIQALAGMMAKHTVSVYDLCRQHDIGLAIPPELWEEKITDSINYLLLLKAVLAEPEDNEEESH